MAGGRRPFPRSGCRLKPRSGEGIAAAIPDCPKGGGRRAVDDPVGAETAGWQLAGRV